MKNSGKSVDVIKQRMGDMPILEKSRMSIGDMGYIHQLQLALAFKNCAFTFVNLPDVL